MLVALSLILFLVGCGSHSLQHIAKSTIGKNYSEWINGYFLPPVIIESKSYRLENGNLVYAHDGCPDREGYAPTPEKDCMIYYEVDSKGIIVNATARFEKSKVK